MKEAQPDFYSYSNKLTEKTKEDYVTKTTYTSFSLAALLLSITVCD